MYIYFCQKCKNLEAFESDNLHEKCPVCNSELVSLYKSVEEWNDLSNEEMLATIKKTQNQFINGVKKPFFIDDHKPEDEFCPSCGEKLDDNAVFCVRCGKTIGNTLKRHGGKKKKKNKIIIPIIALLFLIIIGVFFLVVHKTKEEERLRTMREYYSKADAIVEKIDESNNNFDGLSRIFSVSTELKGGWLFDEHFFTEYATSLCSSEISQEKLRKEDIDKLYNEFDAIICPTEEMKPLHDAVKDYREAYCARFSVLVEGGFSPATFKSKDSSTSSDMSSKKATVKAELEKYAYLFTELDSAEGDEL